MEAVTAATATGNILRLILCPVLGFLFEPSAAIGRDRETLKEGHTSVLPSADFVGCARLGSSDTSRSHRASSVARVVEAPAQS